jgi:hypothetical protein
MSRNWADMVATINCQNATLLIEAKRALLYTHGGTGENRMRMIRGKPFASYVLGISGCLLIARTNNPPLRLPGLANDHLSPKVASSEN